MSDLFTELMSDKTGKSRRVMSLHLPEKLDDRLNEVAEKTGNTKANLVRAILDEGLKELEAKL